MRAIFTEGSILKHICVMTTTATAGLLVFFLVDLVDMFWLSLLGQVELAAAIGYAGSLLFFTMSISIGLSIATTAVVSQSIGRGDMAHTKPLVASGASGGICAAVYLHRAAEHVDNERGHGLVRHSPLDGASQAGNVFNDYWWCR